MKKFSLGLAVLLMAVGFAAFTPKKAAKAFDYTYKYIGTTVAGENTAANYTLSGDAGDCEDTPDDMACQLQSNYAPDGSNNPVFPTTPGYTVRGDITNNHISLWQPKP